MINNVRAVVAATSENNARGATRRYRVLRESRKSADGDCVQCVSVRLLYHVLCSKTELQRLHQRLRKLRISLYISSARRGAT